MAGGAVGVVRCDTLYHSTTAKSGTPNTPNHHDPARWRPHRVAQHPATRHTTKCPKHYNCLNHNPLHRTPTHHSPIHHIPTPHNPTHPSMTPQTPGQDMVKHKTPTLPPIF